MITFMRFGVNMGNLGNQIMQLMTLTAFSKKYNCDLILPKWKYSEYFENPPNQLEANQDILISKTVKEDHFHYTPFLWDQYADDFRDKERAVNIEGWLQSYKYWQEYEKDVYRALEFKRDFVFEVEKKVDELIYQKPIIAISVRQGDYVDNPNYELMPVKFYLLALQEYFPDFREKYNLMIFSDDMEYCKLHFGCLKNVWYADQMSDIEQLCFMATQCQHYIIANSTFSWCGAKLGETSDSIVVCPSYLFAGALLKHSDSRDFYCDHWHKLDHKAKKLNLSNTTFTIPVLYDSRDRKENVDLAIKYLRDNFETTIMVGEQGPQRFEYLADVVNYRHFTGMENFHRTKMLNDMAGDCKTPVIVNWDADVLVPPLQIIEAVRAITVDEYDMVYPYDGRFARVPREYYPTLDRRVDVGCLCRNMFFGMRAGDQKSVGGAIFWNSQSFLQVGLENEHMISYGPEDAERYLRAEKLGFTIKRVTGVLYHVDHVQSMDSSVKHPRFNDNVQEFEKIRAMSEAELRAYVDTWPWATKYTPSYYESIFEESVKSRDAVFYYLKQMEMIKVGTKILDFGCAIGSWGYMAEKVYGVLYRGIDFGVPAEKLVIDPYQYYDHDLRFPLPANAAPHADLVLCLEVAEHIEEKYADQLIDTLCAHGDRVLFSAAIPCQGGVNHVNEQWQSYWVDKFWKRGFGIHDFRGEMQSDPDISLWYKQNMILFIKGAIGLYHKKALPLADFVHPQMYMNVLKHHRILK